MFNGQVNKKSGVLVIQLPDTGCDNYLVAHGEVEKASLYPENKEWFTITSKSEYKSRHPYLPQRIIDNLIKSDVCNYDLSERMRRSNS